MKLIKDVHLILLINTLIPLEIETILILTKFHGMHSEQFLLRIFMVVKSTTFTIVRFWLVWSRCSSLHKVLNLLILCIDLKIQMKFLSPCLMELNSHNFCHGWRNYRVWKAQLGVDCLTKLKRFSNQNKLEEPSANFIDYKMLMKNKLLLKRRKNKRRINKLNGFLKSM